MATHAEREQRRAGIIAAIKKSPPDERIAEVQRQAELHNLHVSYVRNMARAAGLLHRKVKGETVSIGLNAVKRERNAAILAEIKATDKPLRSAKAKELAAANGMSFGYIRNICNEAGIRFGVKGSNRKIEWAFTVVGKYLELGGIAAAADACKTTTERVGEIVRMAKRAKVIE